MIIYDRAFLVKYIFLPIISFVPSLYIISALIYPPSLSSLTHLETVIHETLYKSAKYLLDAREYPSSASQVPIISPYRSFALGESDSSYLTLAGMMMW